MLKKKALCLYLILALSSFAIAQYAGGTGDACDPYQIATAEDLNRIGYNRQLMDKHFLMIEDIDMSSVDIYKIGSTLFPFTGIFDGGHHRIQNIRTNLFDLVDTSDAEIKNVQLINPNIESGSGSLVNVLYRGTISNCTVEGGYHSMAG